MSPLAAYGPMALVLWVIVLGGISLFVATNPWPKPPMILRDFGMLVAVFCLALAWAAAASAF